VSIEVPEPYSTRLYEARRDAGDPLADHIPPHITVLGPTAVTTRDVPAINQHLDAVTAAIPAFDVHLRGTGSFRPISPVVFVEVVEGAEQCEQVEAATRRGPLAQVQRFPYHPHVTIGHEIAEAALDRAFTDMADFDARFNVPALWLYICDDNGVWRKKRRFALRGGQSASTVD
jgi:2'-5' RNA ligase